MIHQGFVIVLLGLQRAQDTALRNTAFSSSEAFGALFCDFQNCKCTFAGSAYAIMKAIKFLKLVPEAMLLDRLPFGDGCIP